MTAEEGDDDGPSAWKDNRLNQNVSSILLEEGRTVIDGQLRRFGQIERQAIWMFRFNALFVGFLVTVGVASIAWDFHSQVPSQAEWTGLLAGGLFIISALFSLFAFIGTTVQIGIDEEYISSVKERQLDKLSLERELLRSYKNWIEKNNQVRKDTYMWMWLSQLALMLGILALVFSAYLVV